MNGAIGNATGKGRTLARPLKVRDDAGLLTWIGAGDRAAFAALMRRFNRRLFRLARAVLRDQAEAENALQEGLLTAFRSIDGFRGETNLATWLSRLVLN